MEVEEEERSGSGENGTAVREWPMLRAHTGDGMPDSHSNELPGGNKTVLMCDAADQWSER